MQSRNQREGKYVGHYKLRAVRHHHKWSKMPCRHTAYIIIFGRDCDKRSMKYLSNA